MDSLEIVRKSLEEYLYEVYNLDEKLQNKYIFSKGDFHQRIYDAFFNLITDPAQTPADIVNQLDTYTRGLDGFSINRPIQTLIGFACLESLSKRNPNVLTPPWEKLLWIIVKYSSFSNLRIFKKTNTETIDWIHKISTEKSCPNPCLRLELFRFIRCFNFYGFWYPKSSRENIIITLFELHDNYKSFTLDQVPNFSPIDLEALILDNELTRCLLNSSDLFIKRTEIITAVLTLTKKLALLEMNEKYQHDNPAIFEPLEGDLEKQLSACLTFCGLIPLRLGLIPLNPLDVDDEDDWILDFTQIVGNNTFLLKYVIDTLETITQVSLSFSGEYTLQYYVKFIKGMILNQFFKGHIDRLPKHLYLQEINGGHAPAAEYRLRYFQDNMNNECFPDEFE